MCQKVFIHAMNNYIILIREYTIPETNRLYKLQLSSIDKIYDKSIINAGGFNGKGIDMCLVNSYP